MKSLCVILARKGSKGIKDKNMTALLGKPLLAYTIEAAVKSNVFDHVVVSTDSLKIAEMSKALGAETPFIRPDSLAMDDTLSKEAVIHAVRETEKFYDCKFDVIAELQCTSPLRDHRHVFEAYTKFIKNRHTCDSLVSVSELNHFHPKKIKKIEQGQLVDLCSHFQEDQIGRRQTSKTYFARNGAIFIMNRSCIMKYRTRVGKKSVPYIMDERSSINIDSYLDLKIAESIMAEDRV